MTWDSTAYQVCLCAIGTVEASMNYGAVNHTDAISVGIMQWYAGRAANILNLMRTTNPTDWVGVPSSLTNDLTAHPSSDSNFWENRYPTQAEINALGNVMTTTGNVTIQDTQAYSDIDGYLSVADSLGLDKDTNTDTAAFFCNIYNRDPASAKRIIGQCGPTSSLSRILSYTLNDSVEGNYRNRYNTAYNIISTHTTTGVGAGTPPSGGTKGGDTGGGTITGNALYMMERGLQLHLQNKDGTKQIFQRTGTGIWLASYDTNVGGGTPPPNGGGTPPPTAITDIINWLASVDNAFAYSQGPGRLDPVKSGYTDCSGLLYYAFLTYADLDIGTYTAPQSKTGTLVTTDPSVAKDGTTVLPGDCTLFKWDNTVNSNGDPFDHTALYIGGNQQQSHGGPDPGPDIETYSTEIDRALSGYYGNGTPGHIMVRRHVT